MVGDRAVTIGSVGQRVKKEQKQCAARGKFSHVIAQVAGVAQLICATADRTCSWIISQNQFDDASMWTRDTTNSSSSIGGAVETDPSKRKGQKGGNVHRPTLNIVENLFLRHDYKEDGQSDCGSSALASVEMISPSVPLVKANTSTVRKHWARWSTLTAAGSGQGIDPEGKIASSMSNSSAWKVVCSNKDNLVMNSCLIALEERRLDVEYANDDDSDNHVSVLSHFCMGHSCILGTKPCLQRLDGFPSKLVRWGHLAESSETKGDFVSGLTKVCNADFLYSLADNYPPQYNELKSLTIPPQP